MTDLLSIFDWDWTVRHLGDIGERFVEHLALAGIALGAGFAISFALSLLIRRVRFLVNPVIWVTGVFYTIPSLALFAILIPITGLSVRTAEIGLISYTLLFLIRSILGGIESVPAEIREAATGMGFTSRQLLWRVDLPLAVPVIIAGLRVATVSTLGLTTVTAVLGYGGFGYLILQEGIDRFFATPVIVGTLLVVAMAVLADNFLIFVQRRITPWAQPRAVGQRA